jgi:protein dithiol oxidoreductase (disulfide-forming)
MRLFKQVFAVLALLCAAYAHGEAVLGKDYKLMNPPQPTTSGKKIEVLEFFSYGCIHCYHLHPYMEAWEKRAAKDVELQYVPVIFNESAEPMARAFYALDAMGLRKKMHDALFKAMFDQHADFSDEKSITEFVAQKGVDRAKFAAAYNSFSLQSRIARSNQLTQSYRIMGTPTVVVDGKYVITGLQPDATVNVLEEEVRMARKERSGR